MSAKESSGGYDSSQPIEAALKVFEEKLNELESLIIIIKGKRGC